MTHILNRTGKAFVILLSLFVVAGCSTAPRQEANDAIQRANEEISAHDELYEQARNTYAEARDSVRQGGSQDGESTAQSQSITEARQKMQRARENLQQARREISGIQELEVSGEVRRYASVMEEALSAQIKAERREISFYEILEEDPTLEENRERAIGILAEAENAYQEARAKYDRASEIAGSNPGLVAPKGGQ